MREGGDCWRSRIQRSRRREVGSGEEGENEEVVGEVGSGEVEDEKGSDPMQDEKITAEVDKPVEAVSDTAKEAEIKGKEAVAEESMGYTFDQLLEINTNVDLTQKGLDGSTASSADRSPALKDLAIVT